MNKRYDELIRALLSISFKCLEKNLRVLFTLLTKSLAITKILSSIPSKISEIVEYKLSPFLYVYPENN